MAAKKKTAKKTAKKIAKPKKAAPRTAPSRAKPVPKTAPAKTKKSAQIARQLAKERARRETKRKTGRFAGYSAEAAKAADASRRERKQIPAGKRVFAYRDNAGRWHHPKTGKVITKTQAKRQLRSTERALLVKNLAKTTGRNEKDVRRSIRGIPTEEFVGRWLYRSKKTGKQVRSEAHGRGAKWLKRRGIVSNLSLLQYDRPKSRSTRQTARIEDFEGDEGNDGEE